MISPSRTSDWSANPPLRTGDSFSFTLCVVPSDLRAKFRLGEAVDGWGGPRRASDPRMHSGTGLATFQRHARLAASPSCAEIDSPIYA